MAPILSRTEDKGTLQELGRASIQIVHDLKNQLNGLKLYATFLKKRLEKGERPADELETVTKLITGLDRMAKDVSLITQFGRPLELNKKPGTNLGQIMREVAGGLKQEDDSQTPAVVEGTEPLTGQFDPILLADALKWISRGALKLNAKARDASLEIQLKDDVT